MVFRSGKLFGFFGLFLEVTFSDGGGNLQDDLRDLPDSSPP